MFSLKEYLIYTDYNNDHECRQYDDTPTIHSLLLFWCPILCPHIPLEKMFPMVQSLHQKKKIQSSIINHEGYKHFTSVHNTIFQLIIKHIHSVYCLPPSVCLPSFFYTIKDFCVKTQRIMCFQKLKLNKLVSHYKKFELFYYASSFLDFAEHRDVQILLFSNVLRVQLLHSISSFIEQTCYTKNDFLILPYSIKPKQRQNVLVVPNDVLTTIQHFMFCEWSSDSSSVRRNTLLISPYVVAHFDTSDTTIFFTIKTLLRLFCVSRSQCRGIIKPNEPGFAIYKYLPRFLSCFSVRRELSKYHTRKFISSTNKKIDNTVPNFLRGLKSFLQLKNEHYIDFKSIKLIYTFLHSKPHTQNIFPQVWDIVNHIMFKTKRKNKISLNDLFFMNGQSFPSYMFIYGMMLHKIVPKKIKQMIWYNIYTTTPIVLPSKLKGIEQMQRHHSLFKSYSSFVNYDKNSQNLTDYNEFLQLMVCLEYRSYMNPSKISFKVSNIPLIKLRKKPTSIPIVAKEKIKTQDVQQTSYVYSNNAWVIRNVEFPQQFSCKREFLFDEYLFNNLMNTI